MHDPFRDGADVQSLDEADDLLQLVLRDAIGPQAHAEKQPQLLFQRQLRVARVRHVAAHDAGRTDLHVVKIPRRPSRQVRAEDLIKLLRRFAEDVVQGLLLRVGFDVDLAQIFVQLRQRHLNGRFYGVGIHRRQLRARHAARHGELIGEHELHQLRQHAVLGAENVLERAVGDVGLFNDLRQRRPPVALFQKEPDADGQNSFFRGQACACNADPDHILRFWCVHQQYSIAMRRTQV